MSRCEDCGPFLALGDCEARLFDGAGYVDSQVLQWSSTQNWTGQLENGSALSWTGPSQAGINPFAESDLVSGIQIQRARYVSWTLNNWIPPTGVTGIVESFGLLARKQDGTLLTSGFPVEFDFVVGSGWDYPNAPPSFDPQALVLFRGSIPDLGFDAFVVPALTFPTDLPAFRFYLRLTNPVFTADGLQVGLTDARHLGGTERLTITVTTCVPAPNQQIINEFVATGDGLTTTFTTAFPYSPLSLEVTVDGILVGADPSNPAAGQFTLSFAPAVGEQVRVYYQYGAP